MTARRLSIARNSKEFESQEKLEFGKVENVKIAEEIVKFSKSKMQQLKDYQKFRKQNKKIQRS